MRRHLLVIAAFAGSVAGTAAQEPAAGRYTIQPDADGFVRFDTRTGAASHCGRQDGIWRCEPFVEDAAAAARDRETLAAEVAALRARVDALAARLDALAPGAVVVRPPSGDPELDRALGFSERLMGRFFEMVREMKRPGDTSPPAP